MEINSSLLIYRERFPERIAKTIFCVAPPNVAHDFLEMVAEATGLSPNLLEIKTVITPGDNAPIDQKTLFHYTVAIGAALRTL
jgi:type IV pilus assembly protein PilM